MSDETEFLWRYHLGRYFNGPAEQRSEAFDFILAQGAAIVPWLMGELVKKREGDREAGRPSHDTLHLAALLVELGDPRSLPLIYVVGDSALVGQLLETLERRASPDDIQALVSVLELSARRWQLEGLALAESLVRIAERTGDRACGAALPLLRYQLLAPRELIGLRKRLKAALSGEDLPIPATRTPDRESLPIPSHEDERR